MLEEAQRKLAHANLPMSNDQLLTFASTAVLESEIVPTPRTSGMKPSREQAQL